MMHYLLISGLTIPFLQAPPKEVDTDPSWREILGHLCRVTPYV
jgi:hypothetical protein